MEKDYGLPTQVLSQTPTGARIPPGIPFALVILTVWLATGLLAMSCQQRGVIGAKEHVIVIGPGGELEIAAKMDTAADRTSIDLGLARSLGIVPDPSENKVKVGTVAGEIELDMTRLTFILDGRRISTSASMGDRTRLDTPMVIGKPDMEGFLVDASREFLTTPVLDRPGTPIPLLGLLSDTQLARLTMIIPILASLVVMLRLLAGVKTFGVFAPTIIGTTLVALKLVPGILIYLILVVIGVSIKILLLNRLRVAHIAEISLVMFSLVAVMAGLTLLPFGQIFSFGAIFFPLIITSHLIEQASRSIEEHSWREAMVLLGSTLATAFALGVLAILLFDLPLAVLWIVFAVAIAAAIATGRYLGLRLTELIRFKFLRRTHVHS
ncbi:MAG: hypothetical protein HY673_16425 [Chloroflexi bacterium]|nr:hypothetical protein [Chloroflexota bacterium]